MLSVSTLSHTASATWATSMRWQIRGWYWPLLSALAQRREWHGRSSISRSLRSPISTVAEARAGYGRRAGGSLSRQSWRRRRMVHKYCITGRRGCATMGQRTVESGRGSEGRSGRAGPQTRSHQSAAVRAIRTIGPIRVSTPSRRRLRWKRCDPSATHRSLPAPPHTVAATPPVGWRGGLPRPLARRRGSPL